MKFEKFIIKYKDLIESKNVDIDFLKYEYERSIEYFESKGYSYGIIIRYFIIFIENNNLNENSHILCEKIRNIGRKYTYEKSILLYGEHFGLIKWENYRKRQAYTNSKEYKNMTDEEFLVYNKSRSITLENMIFKHGEEKGIKVFKNYCDRQAYTNKLEYFIEKYGKIKGKEKWLALNKQKGLSLENFKRKYGEEGIEKYFSYMKNRQMFYSKIGYELFSKLDECLNYNCNIYYSPKTKEFGKYSKELKRYFYYDFVIPSLNFCIEFNGDHFHANPKLFSCEDRPNPFNKNLTAEEIWEHDKMKNSILINQGFDVLIIWESDYSSNKQETISNLVEYINNRKLFYDGNIIIQ